MLINMSDEYGIFDNINAGGAMKTPEQKAYDKLWRDYDKASHALTVMRDKLFPVGTRINNFASYIATVTDGSLYPHQINTDMGHMGWQYEGRKKI